MAWSFRERRSSVWLFALAASTISLTVHAQEPASDPPSANANDLAADAERARAAGLYETCVAADEASLALEDRTTTRIHLVGCAERLGKVLLALRTMQAVLESAVQARSADVAGLASRRVEQLLRRLAQLTVSVPTGTSATRDIKVTIDGAPVPAGSLEKPIAVDPGKHHVHAEGTLNRVPSVFDEVVTVRDGERSTVVVTLRPLTPEFLTPGQLSCMQLAKTQQEVLLCMPGRGKPLVARAAVEMGAYADTLDVQILNPAVRASVGSPASGWNVAASYLVDVVSAASPDIVSTASPRGSDTRHAVSLGGGYKPDWLGIDAGGRFSSESDYVSRSGSVALVADLFEKSVTPRIGYALSHDTIGRGGTSYDVFSNSLTANELSAGSSFVLSKQTIVIAGGTAALERGDQSKPYRLIPMFARGTGPGRGASADVVNAKRLPVRPYEQLPLERDRFTLSARLAHRFSGSTLRLEQRLYSDSWNVRATSTDVRFLVDFGARITAGPHVRFHAQSGANFYHRIYRAETTPVVVVPVFRTTDRELSPLVSGTGGMAMWWRISDARDGIGWMVYASADVLHSVYLDSLYTTHRTAGYGTLGVEAEFE